jgi:CheY-like chemotaxis protein
MSRVLVVEDSATQALEIRLLLEEAGFEVDDAPDGKAALERIADLEPDLVLTDLNMPEMNGLELVEAIRAGHLGVPVILMTQHGTEEIAVQALQRGAASYLTKKNLERDMIEAIEDVLAVTASRKHQERVIESLISTESRFSLENDTALITP